MRIRVRVCAYANTRLQLRVLMRICAALDDLHLTSKWGVGRTDEEGTASLHFVEAHAQGQTGGGIVRCNPPPQVNLDDMAPDPLRGRARRASGLPPRSANCRPTLCPLCLGHVYGAVGAVQPLRCCAVASLRCWRSQSGAMRSLGGRLMCFPSCLALFFLFCTSSDVLQIRSGIRPPALRWWFHSFVSNDTNIRKSQQSFLGRTQRIFLWCQQIVETPESDTPSTPHARELARAVSPPVR